MGAVSAGRRQRRLAASSAGLFLGLLTWGVGPAAATTQTFDYTGTEQLFTVPADVTSVHVVAVGGKGGMGSTDTGSNPFVGGAGAFGVRLEGTLAVTPGEVLYIDVGGNGADGAASRSGGGGGFNGGGSSVAGGFNEPGGGGGGATDIRTCSRLASSCVGAPDSLSSRLLVASGGGGGGSGGQGHSSTGGAGGTAGENGQDGQSADCAPVTPGGGGGAGTASAGGAGGAGGSNGAPAGNPGTFGQGGAAGNTGSNSQPGGGGGGGFYGGGAGGSANGCSGGGGGGGSAFTPPSITSISLDTSGTPGVVLDYTPTPPTPTPPGPVSAVVSHARQTHKTWREPKRPRVAQIARHRPPVGTTFRFDLDKAAAIRLTFTQLLSGRMRGSDCVAPNRHNRHKAKCTRRRGRGSLSFDGHSGTNSVRFFGWLSPSRKLRPGRYTMTIRASTPGARSTSQQLSFTIAR